MKNTFCYIAVVVWLAGSACNSLDGVPSVDSKTSSLTNAEEVRDIIADLPYWLTTAVGFDTAAAAFDDDDIDEYELAAIKLQSYSSSDVRDGIELAIEATKTSVREAAIADAFVLLRVVYDVPEYVGRSDLKVASPFATFAYSASDTQYPILWPVSFGSSGLVSAIANVLAVSGGEYKPLEEFDWFDYKYSHRDIPSCVGRCGNYNASEACQCDTYCEQYGDCCVDYDYTCGSGGGSAATQGGGAPASFAPSNGRPPLR